MMRKVQLYSRWWADRTVVFVCEGLRRTELVTLIYVCSALVGLHNMHGAYIITVIQLLAPNYLMEGSLSYFLCSRGAVRKC